MASRKDGLNSVDKRELGKLVDGDFAMLRLEMESFAAEVLEQRLTTAKSESAAIQRKADQRRTKINKAIADLKAMVQDDDEFSIHVSGWRTPGDLGQAVVTPKQIAQREAEIKDETNRDLAKALNALERARLESRKALSIASLDDESKALLASIPKAQELMREFGFPAMKAVSV